MNDLSKSRFEDITSRMKELPSLPSTVLAILKVLDNPDSTARELSEALHYDQSLVTRILQIVNSAYYGFPREIDTLSKAVTILGYTTIRNLILITNTFDVLNKGVEQGCLDRKQFWQHALGTGVAAQTIADRLQLGSAEEAFLAGLLHDIGKVILDTFLHEEYSQAVKLAQQENLLLYEAEQKVLGATHVDFGQWLADSWNLPHNLTAAIAHHHDPSKSKKHFICVSLVHIGDIVARALEVGNGGDDLIPAINRQAWSALQLKPALLEALLPHFEKKLDQAQAFLPNDN